MVSKMLVDTSSGMQSHVTDSCMRTGELLLCIRLAMFEYAIGVSSCVITRVIRFLSNAFHPFWLKGSSCCSNSVSTGYPASITVVRTAVETQS